MTKRLTNRNVQISLFLTVVLLSLVACKRDSAAEEEVADPETEYFEDYEIPANKWGFLNTRGQVVIPAKYDQVSGFREGLAPVSLEGRWGYIDPNDKVVIPFSFRSAWQFHDGYARVIDFDGTPCILARNGNKICKPDIAELYDFSEGLAAFQQGLATGFMDTLGEVVIQPIFQQAWKFENGMARIMTQDKQGIINKSGEYLIRPEYDRVYPPSNGRILVRLSDKYFFLTEMGDRTGSYFRNATPYMDSVAAVADEQGWRLIDLREMTLNEVRYAHIRSANEGRWIARQVDHLAVLDSRGRELTPFQYTQINNYSEGHAGYLLNGLWGFLDLNGNQLTPPQFGLVWDFHEGLARAAFENGIAFINTKGEVPFIPEYFEMRDFSEGLVPFQE